jgi:hypothetical protein
MASEIAASGYSGISLYPFAARKQSKHGTSLVRPERQSENDLEQAVRAAAEGFGLPLDGQKRFFMLTGRLM